jgi:hypothetical protein
MRRWLLAGVMAGLVLGVVRAEDEVFYLDRTSKKVESVKGTIEEETATGLTVKGKRESKKIASGDIDQISYQVAGVNGAEFRRPFVAEAKAMREKDPKKRAELLDKATDAFQTLEKDLRGRNEARRYIQYKIAQMAVLQARDDATKTEAAIKALTEYKSGNPAGWEILLALKELARLQEAVDRPDDARKTYEELVEVSDLPKDEKWQGELLVSRLLLRGRKYPDAEKRLKGMAAGMPAGDPQKPYIQAYLAESQLGQSNLKEAKAQLEDALKAAGDNRLRGVVHNLLGDYYRGTNQNKEAFWHYLRVDALYNEDPEEQAKALFYLKTLFDKEKSDPVRARECGERLKEERFAGTRWQKLAGDEKK